MHTYEIASVDPHNIFSDFNEELKLSAEYVPPKDPDTETDAGNRKKPRSKEQIVGELLNKGIPEYVRHLTVLQTIGTERWNEHRDTFFEEGIGVDPDDTEAAMLVAAQKAAITKPLNGDFGYLVPQAKGLNENSRRPIRDIERGKPIITAGIPVERPPMEWILTMCEASRIPIGDILQDYSGDALYEELLYIYENKLRHNIVGPGVTVKIPFKLKELAINMIKGLQDTEIVDEYTAFLVKAKPAANRPNDPIKFRVITSRKRSYTSEAEKIVQAHIAGTRTGTYESNRLAHGTGTGDMPGKGKSRTFKSKGGGLL